MAQKRFHTFKRPIASFEENIRFLGILEPGLYRGFDDFTQTGALQIELVHELTGLKQIKPNSSVSSPQITNFISSILTRCGSIIQEDAPVSFNFSPNDTNSEIRIDTLICEYEYLDSVGSQQAIYSVVEGPQNNPIPTPVTNPHHIILGTINIPAGASNISTATFTRVKQPDLGGVDILINHPVLEQLFLKKIDGAKLAEVNLFSQVNTFNNGLISNGTVEVNGMVKNIQGSSVVISDIVPNALVFSETGNYFYTTGIDDLKFIKFLRPGVSVKVFCGSTFIIKSQASGTPSGYGNIITLFNRDLRVYAGDILEFTQDVSQFIITSKNLRQTHLFHSPVVIDINIGNQGNFLISGNYYKIPKAFITSNWLYLSNSTSSPINLSLIEIPDFAYPGFELLIWGIKENQVNGINIINKITTPDPPLTSAHFNLNNNFGDGLSVVIGPNNMTKSLVYHFTGGTEWYEISRSHYS